MSLRPVKVGSLAPGVNNRLEPTQLATVMPDRSRGTYLFGADNVDINQKGFLKRRRGTTSSIAGAAHSLWADAQGGLAVIDDALVQLSAAGAGLTPTTVRAGMARRAVSYSRGADGDVYWSNGVVIRRVSDGADRPVLTPGLATDPVVTATGGGLREGRYLIVFSVVDPIDGESGTASPQQIDLPANSGLHIAGLDGRNVRIYMSGPSGDVPTLQLTTTAASADVVAYEPAGIRCQTLLKDTMPPGTIVRHYNGRMLVASGNVLYVSEPYFYGLTDRSKGYIPFKAPITVVEPTPNGVYICADVTYWISNLFESDLQQVLPYGGVAGSSGYSPRAELAYWMSPKGLVTGDQNMSVKNTQEDALEFGAAASGASIYRERDGMRQVVSTRFGSEISIGAANSYMTAEVVRKETRL